MNVNLSKEIAAHFKRVKALAQEAAEDEEESYSSRASAMASVTTVLKELTKTQAEVVNMERLSNIERVTIAVVKKHLTPEAAEEFVKELKEALNES